MEEQRRLFGMAKKIMTEYIERGAATQAAINEVWLGQTSTRCRDIVYGLCNKDFCSHAERRVTNGLK